MIEPALTAEEWATQPIAAERNSGGKRDWVSASLYPSGRLFASDEYSVVSFDAGVERHAVAALALHGQPFGFTWEDVDGLNKFGTDYGHWPFNDLADRIAALLPPR